MSEVYKPTVAIDFDGVINPMTCGYLIADRVPPDPPTVGIKELIDELRNNNYQVVIMTCRCSFPGGEKSVQEYLDMYNIEVDLITDQKVPAIVYLDDRGIQFDGNTSGLLCRIKNFKPWYQ